MTSVIPLYTIITIVFGRINKRLAKVYQDKVADTSVIAEESFGNIRTVKSFAAENKEIAFYNRMIYEVYKVGRRKCAWEAIYFALTQIFTYSGTLAILWYGGYLVL